MGSDVPKIEVNVYNISGNRNVQIPKLGQVQCDQSTTVKGKRAAAEQNDELPTKQSQKEQSTSQDASPPKTGCDRITNMIRATELQLISVNSNVYVQTRAYDKGRQLLKDLGFLVLIGNPGSGKTTLGLSLMSYFKNEEKRQPLYLTDCSNFEDIPLSGCFVVMVDNIYGNSNLVTELQNMWQRKFETMYSIVQSGKMKFIITFRTKIFNECTKSLKEFSLFSETCQIDLHGSDYCLTYEEKRKMLEKIPGAD
ncbi:uncharacterized protein LOC121387757 [Gigantopelta aegis]|uniref:uncharacterized protein LOC121387757 n=1 Tax=Gigantopelta aegis TaxID=1735272 RepID=UPI001B8876C4|nr:uncharacterized protein LOC121387757 [Gigantopelta aegis]